jgi:hypothetical protein
MKDKEDIIADVVVAIIVLTTLGLFIIALL